MPKKIQEMSWRQEPLEKALIKSFL
jgi:hypothetical protein